MWDINGNGLNYFTYNVTNLPQEEVEVLEKNIPDNIGIYRLKDNIGLSVENLEYNLLQRFKRFYHPLEARVPKVDTIIFILPQSSILQHNVRSSTHLKGYRDMEKSEVFVQVNPQNSLSLVCEFLSGKNATYDTDGISYPLGNVYELGDRFRKIITDDLGESYSTLVEKFYIVTSHYAEQNEVDSLKALHIVMKGIYKIAGLNNSVPLKKWVEAYRRLGAKEYVSRLALNLKRDKQRLVNEMEGLKSQMSEYFRKIHPIDFFLNDQEGVLNKISEQLTSCENIKDVKSAYIDSQGSFHVFTDHIYIKQPSNQRSVPGLSPEESSEMIAKMINRYWDIGRLHITVKKDSTHIVSNTRQVKGFNGHYVGHPHVIQADNSVCLGEIATVVYELLNLHEYSNLAGLLVNFAKSVNLDDSAGKFVRKWPTIQLNPS